jgi:hypothetical protein
MLPAVASATANDATSTSTPATVTLGVGGVDVTPAAITPVRVFPRTWKRGRRLPRASARTGTRISWRLSEAARVRIVFQRRSARDSSAPARSWSRAPTRA